MQRAIATKAHWGECNLQRIAALANVQLTEAHRLTEHALKGAEEHASMICLAYYIKATLLVKVARSTYP